MKLHDLVGGRNRYWYLIVVHHGGDNPTIVTSTSATQSTATATTKARNAWASNTLVASGHCVLCLRDSTMHAIFGETPLYTFQTPLLAQQPTSLALVGDLGQMGISTKTMNHILDQVTMTTTNHQVPVSTLLIAV